METEKTGIAESAFVVEGGGEATFAELGAAIAPRVASGIAARERLRAGTATSPHSASATYEFFFDGRGRAEMGMSAGGPGLRLQQTTLEFESDAVQYPPVRFTGICSRPYVENRSTGQAIFVRVDLAAGEELEIDMLRRTVRVDGGMVWGYTGRWFGVKPGDVVLAGAESVGAGFSSEIDLAVVGGLVTMLTSGVGRAEMTAPAARQVDVARTGSAVSGRAGSAGRNGVGAGKAALVGSGVAVKTRDFE